MNQEELETNFQGNIKQLNETLNKKTNPLKISKVLRTSKPLQLRKKRKQSKSRVKKMLIT